MTDDKWQAKARELYDCLKDAQEKGAWVESQLTIIAAALRQAAEDENEACAKVADAETSLVPIVAPGTNSAYDECARAIAAAIRARREAKDAI